MTKRVYKYELGAEEAQAVAPGVTIFELTLPLGAQVLTAGVHGSQAVPCIWTLVNDKEISTLCYHFLCVTTNAELPDSLDKEFNTDDLRYISSYVYGGNEVHHLFQLD